MLRNRKQKAIGLSDIFSFLTSSLNVTTFCLLDPFGANFFNKFATCLGSFIATALGADGGTGAVTVGAAVALLLTVLLADCVGDVGGVFELFGFACPDVVFAVFTFAVTLGEGGLFGVCGGITIGGIP